MKKLLALLALLLAVWLVLNHDRIYFHDFLAKVTVAGTPDTTRSIYVNTGDDVLLIGHDSPPTLELVRSGGAAPVLAGSLNCIYGLACLTHKEDSAALAASRLLPSGQVAKGSRSVSFRDEAGRPVTIRLH